MQAILPSPVHATSAQAISEANKFPLFGSTGTIPESEAQLIWSLVHLWCYTILTTGPTCSMCLPPALGGASIPPANPEDPDVMSRGTGTAAATAPSCGATTAVTSPLGGGTALGFTGTTLPSGGSPGMSENRTDQGLIILTVYGLIKDLPIKTTTLNVSFWCATTSVYYFLLVLPV